METYRQLIMEDTGIEGMFSVQDMKGLRDILYTDPRISQDTSYKYITCHSFLSLFNRKACYTLDLLVSCLAFSSILITVVTCSHKISVDLQWTTKRYTQEGRTLHPQRYLNADCYS
jgi:hypothetical protein